MLTYAEIIKFQTINMSRPLRGKNIQKLAYYLFPLLLLVSKTSNIFQLLRLRKERSSSHIKYVKKAGVNILMLFNCSPRYSPNLEHCYRVGKSSILLRSFTCFLKECRMWKTI